MEKRVKKFSVGNVSEILSDRQMKETSGGNKPIGCVIQYCGNGDIYRLPYCTSDFCCGSGVTDCVPCF